MSTHTQKKPGSSGLLSLQFRNIILLSILGQGVVGIGKLTLCTDGKILSAFHLTIGAKYKQEGSGPDPNRYLLQLLELDKI